MIRHFHVRHFQRPQVFINPGLKVIIVHLSLSRAYDGLARPGHF